VAQLTPEGQAELAEQDRRANAVAADLLSGLSAGQRADVTGAIRSAERLLRLSAITIEVADPRGPMRAVASPRLPPRSTTASPRALTRRT
jgi:hypothetical protein